MSKHTPLDPMDALEALNEITSFGPMGRGMKVIYERSVSNFVYCVCKHINLENGGSLSVQASEPLYCIPRDNKGPYTHVEVGFPRGVRIPDTWKEYADYWDRDGDGGDGWKSSDVFAYVPVELVRDLILANSPKLRAQLEAATKQLTDDL